MDCNPKPKTRAELHRDEGDGLISSCNLVPRVSPIHAPGCERGETLVGAGYVSPREKLDPGRGPSPASLCLDLLFTPKRGFRFAARSSRETHSTGFVFQ